MVYAVDRIFVAVASGAEFEPHYFDQLFHKDVFLIYLEFIASSKCSYLQ